LNRLWNLLSVSSNPVMGLHTIQNSMKKSYRRCHRAKWGGSIPLMPVWCMCSRFRLIPRLANLLAIIHFENM
jgi:hypothetical protein